MKIEDINKMNLFLLDMDGTIYEGNRLFDYTNDLLKKIRQSNKKYLFMTNNSSKSVTDYVQKLKKLGIRAQEDEFITSSQATALYLKLHHKDANIYVCGTNSLKSELKKEDLFITENPDDADLIVVGYDTELTYKKLEDVSRLLNNKDIAYYATHPDMVCPTEFGNIPDCGSICEMLYQATGKRPIVIGKPEALMPEMAMKKYGYQKSETVIIGDRIYTDIKSALNAGVAGVLTMSGETTAEILENSEVKPDLVIRDCSELINYI